MGIISGEMYPGNHVALAILDVVSHRDPAMIIGVFEGAEVVGAVLGKVFRLIEEVQVGEGIGDFKLDALNEIIRLGVLAEPVLVPVQKIIILFTNLHSINSSLALGRNPFLIYIDIIAHGLCFVKSFFEKK
jgi:hypothetical protein